MKSRIESRKTKRRFTAAWQNLLGGLAIIWAIAFPKSVHAAFRSDVQESFSERATKVKSAIEQMARTVKQPGAIPHEMQWGNWPNWQNWNDWPNWGNWNNWNNWQNWRNW